MYNHNLGFYLDGLHLSLNNFLLNYIIQKFIIDMDSSSSLSYTQWPGDGRSEFWVISIPSGKYIPKIFLVLSHDLFQPFNFHFLRTFDQNLFCRSPPGYATLSVLLLLFYCPKITEREKIYGIYRTTQEPRIPMNFTELNTT